MKITLIEEEHQNTHLLLDSEALHVLSAALKFTSGLNERCREFADQLEALLPSNTEVF